MLTWAEGTTPEQHQAVVDALSTMPGLIPEIRNYTIGSDAGISDGNADLVVIGEFDDVAGYQTYAAQPDHVAAINDLIKPILAARAAVQFEY